MARTAVVTGAGRGIGAMVARRLAHDGWRVGVLDVDPKGVSASAATVPGSVPLVADVADEGAVRACLDELGEVPTLLVNNAGIVRFGPLLGLSLEDFSVVTRVNLIGTFVVGRAVAERMVAAGAPGSIVNVTSMNGIAAGVNGGAYGSTKAGVALLTQQMALEWGSYGIRVNAVAPGLINAGMSNPIYADPEVRQARESKVPLGRLGTGDDIADAVSFLASDRASYITGQNILVDGGVTMSILAHLPRPASVDSVGPG